MQRPLVAFAALVLFVVSAGSAPAWAEGGAAADKPVGVAVDDFSYRDTSGEPADQTALHEKRLQAFMGALRRDIAADPRFQLVQSAQEGAAFKVIGGIQKMSTLVQWAKVAVIDTAAGKLLTEKLYTFRGDSDEAW
jgi:hypothetical protein